MNKDNDSARKVELAMTTDTTSGDGLAGVGGHLRSPDVNLMLQRLDELSTFGALPDGSQNRLPYSQADQQVRELFSQWAVQSGLPARSDAVGNVIVRVEGSRSDLAPVMVGSHLDTQPVGGKFDGIAGTLAALAVGESLVQSGVRPRRSIEIVAWAGEEGSGRFDVGCIGSRAMVGALTQEHLNLRCRFTGETLADAMRACGLDPAQTESCERPPESIHSVIEMHIEQGPYLEEAGVSLGIVKAISGNRRVPLTIRGVQAHSGAQPMSHRRDALAAAAEVITMAEAMATNSQAPLVATSGMFDHHPRSIAAVPGLAELTIDLRSPDFQTLVNAEEELVSRAASICSRRGVALEPGQVWGMEPSYTDAGLFEILKQACTEIGEEFLIMNSGAGHDSLILGQRFPAGLLFVPSRGGLSHCPEEFTDSDDLAKGVLALQLAVFSAANSTPINSH